MSPTLSHAPATSMEILGSVPAKSLAQTEPPNIMPGCLEGQLGSRLPENGPLGPGPPTSLPTHHPPCPTPNGPCSVLPYSFNPQPCTSHPWLGQPYLFRKVWRLKLASMSWRTSLHQLANTLEVHWVSARDLHWSKIAFGLLTDSRAKELAQIQGHHCEVEVQWRGKENKISFPLWNLLIHLPSGYSVSLYDMTALTGGRFELLGPNPIQFSSAGAVGASLWPSKGRRTRVPLPWGCITATLELESWIWLDP